MVFGPALPAQFLHNRGRHRMQTRSDAFFMKVGTLALVLIPLAGTVVAGWLAWRHIFNWRDIALLVGFYVPISLGVTVGFHRYATHAGFRAHPVVKVALLVLGSMALVGTPIDFAGNHRKHHALSDRPGDPHSPIEGLLHAHVGWLMTVDQTENRRYARDLCEDRTVVWISHLFLLWIVLGLAGPFLLGGWEGFLWGGVVRVFLTHHVTWSVNSVCHSFGRRPFETRDRSRNEWIVGLLALGEGWHNNHHAFPRSAMHGLRWWQFDASGLVIRLLGYLRLAHEIQRAGAADIRIRLDRQAARQVA
jgi:stearoyl-CoA desaturase (delta-9 desaturase)